MSPSRSVLVVSSCAVALTGCVLNWDGVWPDSGVTRDGQGDRGQAPDGLRPDALPDSKVTPPDMAIGPCKNKPAGAVCRKAPQDCDVEETCDGVSDQCPPDKFHIKGKVCRASTGPCDPEEKCAGANKLCPADLKWANKQMTFSTTKGTDGFISKYASNKYKLTTGSVRSYCRPDTPSGVELARGFISFDTKALPASAVVSSAKLTCCFMSAPNYKSAYTDLYPATFTLPATTAIYNAPTATPKTKMPRTVGINTFSVPVSSIKLADLTQYQLRWPIVTCNTWTGQVWTSASSTTSNGACAAALYPWKLVVDFCGP